MAGRQNGVVKAWIEQKGMGFIAPESGAEDHFVHRSMLTDGGALHVGAHVSFEPGWDAGKNKPIANAVQGAIASPAVQPGPPPPQNWVNNAGKGGSATGVVKAWIDNRGMGFITPHSGGEDLFVHRSMLADGQTLIIGAQVSYDAGWDQMKNKGTAQNVRGASQIPQQAQDNLYISGLPNELSEEKLWQTFGQYGTVTNAKLLSDNGSPFRVALVKMADPQQAQWMIMNLDGNIPLGLENVIGVKYAAGDRGATGPPKPTQVLPPSWGAPAAAHHAAPVKSDNLYVCGLPLESTQDSVNAIMGQYGTITSMKLLPANGKPDIAALIRMSAVAEAEWMVNNLNGNIPQGLETVVQIKFASQGGKGGGKDFGPAAAAAHHQSPYGKGGYAPGAPPPPPPAQQAWAAPAAPAPAAKNTIIIGGLPQDSTSESIRTVIGQYGNIKSVILKPDKTALVQMGDEEEVQWILQNLDGNIPQGLESVISVKQQVGGPPPAPAAHHHSAPPAVGRPPQSSGFVTGTVKHWVEERGMGFIAPNTGEPDCFVHRSNLVDGLSLVTGGQVTFQQDWDQQKNKAVAIHVSGAFGGDGQGKGAARFQATGGAGGKGYSSGPPPSAPPAPPAHTPKFISPDQAPNWGLQ
jgi:cold shock CspA family protein